MGVDPVQVPHEAREITFRSTQHQMVMVAHEAIGMDLGMEPVADVLEQFEKIPTIRVVPEYSLASCTPVHDVVPRPFKFDP